MAGSKHEVHAYCYRGPYNPEGCGNCDVEQHSFHVAPTSANEVAQSDCAGEQSANPYAKSQCPLGGDYI